MTLVAYKIYYSSEGQGNRSLLTDEQIAYALQRFPNDCDIRLPDGSSVSVRSREMCSIVVAINSPANADDIRAAVAESADSLQLFGNLIE